MKKATKNKIVIIKRQDNNHCLISYNIAKNNKLSANAKEIYLYLSSHNENFYISYTLIARYFNMSESKLKRIIKELKQSGFLEIEKNGDAYTYKLYEDTSNEEYKIIENLKQDKLDFTDIKAIYRILNNQKISQETRDKVNEKLKSILNAKWLD